MGGTSRCLLTFHRPGVCFFFGKCWAIFRRDLWSSTTDLKYVHKISSQKSWQIQWTCSRILGANWTNLFEFFSSSSWITFPSFFLKPPKICLLTVNCESWAPWELVLSGNSEPSSARSNRSTAFHHIPKTRFWEAGFTVKTRRLFDFLWKKWRYQKKGRYIDAVLDDFWKDSCKYVTWKTYHYIGMWKHLPLLPETHYESSSTNFSFFWKHDQLFTMKNPPLQLKAFKRPEQKTDVLKHTLMAFLPGPPENLCTLQTELLRHISTELVIAFKQCRRKAKTWIFGVYKLRLLPGCRGKGWLVSSDQRGYLNLPGKPFVPYVLRQLDCWLSGVKLPKKIGHLAFQVLISYL